MSDSIKAHQSKLQGCVDQLSKAGAWVPASGLPCPCLQTGLPSAAAGLPPACQAASCCRRLLAGARTPSARHWSHGCTGTSSNLAGAQTPAATKRCTRLAPFNRHVLSCSACPARCHISSSFPAGPAGPAGTWRSFISSRCRRVQGRSRLVTGFTFEPSWASAVQHRELAGQVVRQEAGGTRGAFNRAGRRPGSLKISEAPMAADASLPTNTSRRPLMAPSCWLRGSGAWRKMSSHRYAQRGTKYATPRASCDASQEVLKCLHC